MRGKQRIGVKYSGRGGWDEDSEWLAVREAKPGNLRRVPSTAHLTSSQLAPNTAALYPPPPPPLASFHPLYTNLSLPYPPFTPLH